MYWPPSRGIKELEVVPAEAGEDLVGRGPFLGLGARQERAAGTSTLPGLDRIFRRLSGSSCHRGCLRASCAVVGQGPPEAGGELALAIRTTGIMWVESPIPCSAMASANRAGEHLGGDWVVEIDDVLGPVHVNRPWDMAADDTRRGLLGKSPPRRPAPGGE